MKTNLSKKIPVAVLGATGAVGQRFVQLLADHPWFEVVALTGSVRSVGKAYGETRWVLDGDPPETARNLIIRHSTPDLPAKLVFSALPSSHAKEIEPRFAAAGYAVCSNASAYRQAAGVPLIIPEVNGDHLVLIKRQRAERGWPGLIVTSPNCTTSGLAMTLKPLDDAFGVRQVFVTTMQAVSGAGYPGVSYLDIDGNVIPYIGGEEDKIENEACILLGHIENDSRRAADFLVSAQANRVPVFDGHTLSIAVGFERKPSPEEATRVLVDFPGLDLPSAPPRPVLVRSEADRPQPRRDRSTAEGMAVTVGRIRECPILDLRMVSVVHNTLRGAASGSILNAELLVAEGYL
ncbi:MAG: aspartate-semialdehyde dehydrogenase [Anaerolineae bacterium]|nr:aspartate-semialdehyde dehydrogenase [Anaerolineae bacterium]